MTTLETQVKEANPEDLDLFYSKELESQEELSLAARIDMYAIMADVYRYPDAMTRLYVRQGEFKSHVLRIVGNLPYVLKMDDDEIQGLTYPDNLKDEDVEVEYIRVFEAGPGTPPCPLVEGIHMGKEDGRISIFKDLILFYNNFGLSYAEGNSEDRPDHIAYELEFLHYLAFLELKALQTGKDPQPLRRAQKEFLERHPAKWTGILVNRIKTIEADLREGVNSDVVGFYRNIMVLTDRFVTDDFNYLEGLTEN
ncbi:MAG: molecular chaperone TorD family protein [Proteobacteria bacterium]|nr:molecular chaperone TorD family protein [Pseudomonadota bacterium]